VVFISIDDGTGCIDSVFFHEAQEESGPLLFGTRLLLIRGTTRRTGPKGISLSATKAWDLSNPETLPFPEKPGSGVVDPRERFLPAPLDGISRNLAITGLGS
jgi:error-prone DNA polymerase